MTNTGKQKLLYEDINIGNNIFEIILFSNDDISLKYLNYLELHKIYIIKNIKKYNQDSISTYDEIKNNLKINKFELIEKDNILNIKINLFGKYYKIQFDDEFELSFIQKIKEIKEQEINQLKKQNNEILNKNILDNNNLKCEIQNKEKKINDLEKENYKLKNELEEINKKFNELNNIEEKYKDLNEKYNLLNDSKNKFEKMYFDLQEQYDELKKSCINNIDINEKLCLNDFNNKYKTKIENTTITKLNLGCKKEGNRLIKTLSYMEFDNLQELKLFKDEISDLSPLLNMKTQNLQILQLDNNKINDISILEKINLDNLKNLNLQKNNITDISPLKNIKSLYLEILLLNNNSISDISVLSEVKFKGLKKLTLHDNQIKDINVLKQVPFIQNLEFLTLNNNNIKDIEVFNNVKFFNMKSLYLFKNEFNENENTTAKSLKKSIKDYL